MTIHSNRWTGTIKEACLLTQISVSDDRPDYSTRVAGIEGVNSVHQTGAWTKFIFTHYQNQYNVALFCKRMIISKHEEGISLSEKSLSKILETGLSLKPHLENVANILAKALAQDSFKHLHSYLILWCDQPSHRCMSFRMCFHKINRVPSSGWIDDGMTTFYVKAYDSRSNRLGYIRISRHLGICYSLSERLQQEISNLIFETFFYESGPITADKVFSLFNALSRYVLPTELNLFLQQIFLKLATFAIVAGLFINFFNKSLELLRTPIEGQLTAGSFLGLTITCSRILDISYLGLLYFFAGVGLWLIWQIVSAVVDKKRPL